jgi:2-oxopent-4-enoate/cis-2-oxohex-4-enoate hydratase
MMEQERINQLGDELYTALRTQTTLSPLTEREPMITIEDAYHISQRMVQQRLTRDGERIVGKKIGVTTSVSSPTKWSTPRARQSRSQAI